MRNPSVFMVFSPPPPQLRSCDDLTVAREGPKGHSRCRPPIKSRRAPGDKMHLDYGQYLHSDTHIISFCQSIFFCGLLGAARAFDAKRTLYL